MLARLMVHEVLVTFEGDLGAQVFSHAVQLGLRRRLALFLARAGSVQGTSQSVLLVVQSRRSTLALIFQV